MWTCGICYGYGTCCTQNRHACLDCDGTCQCDLPCICLGSGTTNNWTDSVEAQVDWP